MRSSLPLLILALSVAVISAADTCFDVKDDCSEHENKCFKRRYQAESFSRCRRTCRLCVPPGYEDYFSGTADSDRLRITQHQRRRHTRAVADDAQQAIDSDKCGDLGPDCLQYTNYCTNQYYVEFMMAHCPLSCGYCPTTFAQSGSSTGSSGCNDIVQECKELVRIGFCESDEQPAAVKKALCARTCKLCNTTESQPTAETAPTTPPPLSPTITKQIGPLSERSGRLYRGYNRFWPYDRAPYDDCADQYAACDELLASTEEGVCEHRTGYVLCRRSCGYCTRRPSLPKFDGRSRLTILIPPRRRGLERGLAPTRVPVTLPGRAIVIGAPILQRNLRRELGANPAFRRFSKYRGFDSWRDSDGGRRRSSSSWDAWSSDDSLDSFDSDGSDWSSSSPSESDDYSWDSSSEDSLEARIRRLDFNQVPNPPTGTTNHRISSTNRVPNEADKATEKQPKAVIVIDGREYPLDKVPTQLEELLRQKAVTDSLAEKTNTRKTEDTKHRVGHVRPPRRSHTAGGGRTGLDRRSNGRIEDRNGLDGDRKSNDRYRLKNKQGEKTSETNLAKALFALKKASEAKKIDEGGRQSGKNRHRRRLYRDENGRLKLIEPEESRDGSDVSENYNAQLPNGVIDDGERSDESGSPLKFGTSEDKIAESTDNGVENPSEKAEDSLAKDQKPLDGTKIPQDKAEKPLEQDAIVPSEATDGADIDGALLNHRDEAPAKAVYNSNELGTVDSTAQLTRRKRQTPSPTSEFSGNETKIHVNRDGRIEMGANDKDFRFAIDESAVPWRLPKQAVGNKG